MSSTSQAFNDLSYIKLKNPLAVNDYSFNKRVLAARTGFEPVLPG